jgi:hypothetical protein
MSLLAKRQQLGIKTEGTEGSVETLGVGDYVLAENVSFKPDIEMVERNFARATLDSLSSVAGKRKGEVTFSLPVKGTGTPQTPYAPFGACLLAAGCSETVVGGNSVVYVPISDMVANYSSPAKTCTVEFLLDGLRTHLTGCIANVKFRGKAGQFAYMDVSLKGVYEQPTDSALVSPTYLSTVEQIVQSSSFSFDGITTFVVDSFEIDFGNEVVERPNVRSASGLGGFLLTGRKPVGSIDPELTLVATYNFLSKQVAAVPGILSFVVGTGTGQKLSFSMPKVQITGVDLGERNGIAVATCKLQMNASAAAGNDWFSFTQSS